MGDTIKRTTLLAAAAALAHVRAVAQRPEAQKAAPRTMGDTIEEALELLSERIDNGLVNRHPEAKRALTTLRAEIARLRKKCDTCDGDGFIVQVVGWKDNGPDFPTEVMGDPEPCPDCDDREKLRAEVARLRGALERSELEVEEEIQRRDRYHDAITEAHVALGGDGEWRAHVGGSPPIGESGHLHLDVPVMARRLREEAEKAREEAELAARSAAISEDLLGEAYNDGYEAGLVAVRDRAVTADPPTGSHPGHGGDSRDTGSWTAWLIEHGTPAPDGCPRYASFEEGGCVWTKDPIKACHFVRREDAEQLAYGEDCWAIREHEFVGPWSGSPVPQERAARENGAT